MIFIAGDIHGTIDIDKVIRYFSAENIIFEKWFCGHFHEDMVIEEKYHVMMDEIIQI